MSNTPTAAVPTGGPAAGDTAPGFNLPAAGGGSLSLRDLAGKKVVLYFYPKDDTSGCTKEAIEFSALAKDFAKAGITVIGCSKDSIASHDKFKAKHDLAVALVSDAAGEACAAYGTWVEKSMYGRKYMGIERATFLVDGKGKVRHVWRKVKVPGHAAEVLAAAQKL